MLFSVYFSCILTVDLAGSTGDLPVLHAWAAPLCAWLCSLTQAGRVVCVSGTILMLFICVILGNFPTTLFDWPGNWGRELLSGYRQQRGSGWSGSPVLPHILLTQSQMTAHAGREDLLWWRGGDHSLSNRKCFGVSTIGRTADHAGHSSHCWAGAQWPPRALCPRSRSWSRPKAAREGRALWLWVRRGISRWPYCSWFSLCFLYLFGL